MRTSPNQPSTQTLENVARLAALRAERRDVSNQMNDMMASDTPFDTARDNSYNELRDRILGTIGEGGKPGIDRQIEALTVQMGPQGSLTPGIIMPNREKSAFARWLVDGVNGIDDAEAKLFLSNPPEGTALPGGGATGELSKKLFRIAPPEIYGALTTPADRPSGVADVTTVAQVIHNLRAFGSVANMAWQTETERGETMRIPGLDSKDQEGEMLTAENTAAADLNNPAFSDVPFNAYVFSSKVAAVSNPFLNDAVIDIEALVRMLLVRRVGRICNRLSTLGTGVNQPQGIVTAAMPGVTAAAVDSISWDELLKMIHAVDPAYRIKMESMSPADGGFMSEGGVIGWQFNDTMLQAIAQLKDGEGRPLFLPSIREGEPNRVFGYPYQINQHMASPAAGTIPALFGDFSYYGIRRVTDMMFYRFTDSVYTINNVTGFLMFVRMDARYRGALTSVGGANVCEAVVKLTMAAA